MFNAFCFMYYVAIAVAISFVATRGGTLNETWIVVFSIAILIGGWLLEYKKRQCSPQNNSSLIGIVVTLFILGFGLLAGQLLPTYGLQFLPFGLLYSVLVFIVLAFPEVLVARKLSPKITAAYSLNGSLFPYFALGAAIQVALRT